ncbi:virion core protein, T7 gp14 family, partial [Xylella fastidiosa]|uniref:virion core protein, T7 gp14 family n=1 Tax=Xylella fastidiosa TaxID=2371 RepID=UPI00139C5016|nr:internal virion protein B [Xylella fastidiosa subsp. multiplex]
MCWMAAIPIAMAGAQALSSQHSADKARVAQTESGRRQAIEMVKEMNIQSANASLEQRDALEA